MQIPFFSNIGRLSKKAVCRILALVLSASCIDISAQSMIAVLSKTPSVQFPSGFFPPHALCRCHRNSLPHPYRPEREVAVTEETSPFALPFCRRRNGRDFGYVDYRNAGIVNVPVYRILIWMRLHDLLLD